MEFVNPSKLGFNDFRQNGPPQRLTQSAVLALKFVYCAREYLDGKRATLISRSDDISIPSFLVS
jgi:hypothetical protein